MVRRALVAEPADALPVLEAGLEQLAGCVDEQPGSVEAVEAACLCAVAVTRCGYHDVLVQSSLASWLRDAASVRMLAYPLRRAVGAMVSATLQEPIRSQVWRAAYEEWTQGEDPVLRKPTHAQPLPSLEQEDAELRDAWRREVCMRAQRVVAAGILSQRVAQWLHTRVHRVPRASETLSFRLALVDASGNAVDAGKAVEGVARIAYLSSKPRRRFVATSADDAAADILAALEAGAARLAVGL